MNDWQQYLIAHGFVANNDSNADSIGSIGELKRDGLTSGFVSPLNELGLIAVSGEDAADFLHNQLSNDVLHLDQSTARLAGYCSAKGRLLATFMVWRSDEVYFLQLPREILPAIQKRLQMFVLRAKAKLADVSEQYVVLGLGGEAIPSALNAWFPNLPDAPYVKLTTESGTLIRVPDAFGTARYEWLMTVEQAKKSWPSLAATLNALHSRAWRLTDIHAGIPQITLATQEKFVPQMINFELIGGVNFKKGCYPGQEIVARSQYLGKLKRRMLLASINNANVAPGMDLFSSADPEQPCGMVVNAESNGSGMDCLVEMKIASVDSGTVHLESVTGPALHFGTLPYRLPVDNE